MAQTSDAARLAAWRRLWADLLAAPEAKPATDAGTLRDAETPLRFPQKKWGEETSTQLNPTAKSAKGQGVVNVTDSSFSVQLRRFIIQEELVQLDVSAGTQEEADALAAKMTPEEIRASSDPEDGLGAQTDWSLYDGETWEEFTASLKSACSWLIGHADEIVAVLESEQEAFASYCAQLLAESKLGTAKPSPASNQESR
jgi:hypothetical protein